MEVVATSSISSGAAVDALFEWRGGEGETDDVGRSTSGANERACGRESGGNGSTVSDVDGDCNEEEIGQVENRHEYGNYETRQVNDLDKEERPEPLQYPLIFGTIDGSLFETTISSHSNDSNVVNAIDINCGMETRKITSVVINRESSRQRRFAAARQNGRVDVYESPRAGDKEVDCKTYHLIATISPPCDSYEISSEEVVLSWFGEELLLVGSIGVLSAYEINASTVSISTSHPHFRESLQPLWEVALGDNYESPANKTFDVDMKIISISASSKSNCILLLAEDCNMCDNSSSVPFTGALSGNYSRVFLFHAFDRVQAPRTVSIERDVRGQSSIIVSASLCDDVAVPLFFLKDDSGLIGIYRRPIYTDMTEAVCYHDRTGDSLPGNRCSSNHMIGKVVRASSLRSANDAIMTWLPRKSSVGQNKRARSSTVCKSLKESVRAIRTTAMLSPQWALIIDFPQKLRSGRLVRDDGLPCVPYQCLVNLVIVRGWDGPMAMITQTLLCIDTDSTLLTCINNNNVSSEEPVTQIRNSCLSALWNVCEESDDSTRHSTKTKGQINIILASALFRSSSESCSSTIIQKLSADVDDQTHLQVAISLNDTNNVIERDHEEFSRTSDDNSDDHDDDRDNDENGINNEYPDDVELPSAIFDDDRTIGLEASDKALLSTTANLEVKVLLGNDAKIKQVLAIDTNDVDSLRIGKTRVLSLSMDGTLSLSGTDDSGFQRMITIARNIQCITRTIIDCISGQMICLILCMGRDNYIYRIEPLSKQVYRIALYDASLDVESINAISVIGVSQNFIDIALEVDGMNTLLSIPYNYSTKDDTGCAIASVVATINNLLYCPRILCPMFKIGDGMLVHKVSMPTTFITSTQKDLKFWQFSRNKEDGQITVNVVCELKVNQSEAEKTIMTRISKGWTRIAVLMCSRDKQIVEDSLESQRIIQLKIYQAASIHASFSEDNYRNCDTRNLPLFWMYNEESSVILMNGLQTMREDNIVNNEMHMEWIETSCCLSYLVILLNDDVFIIHGEKSNDLRTTMAWNIVRHLRLIDYFDNHILSIGLPSSSIKLMDCASDRTIFFADTHKIFRLDPRFTEFDGEPFLKESPEVMPKILFHVKRGDITTVMHILDEELSNVLASKNSAKGRNAKKSNFLDLENWIPSDTIQISGGHSLTGPRVLLWEMCNFFQEIVRVHEAGMDAAARRVIVNILMNESKFSKLTCKTVLSVEDEIFAFCSASKSKSSITNCLEAYYRSKSMNIDTWTCCCKIGGPYWMEEDKLKAILETRAKTKFMSKKDPMDCALLYTALKKVAILKGLFRVKRDERMVDFLDKDFNRDENKTAAIKNAYVLLGQRRFELAATFFLLAGEIKDAVNVVLKSMADVQLAVAITRITCASPHKEKSDFNFASFIDDHLIPLSLESGQEWRVAMLHIIRGRSTDSVMTLLRSHRIQNSYDSVLDFMMATTKGTFESARSIFGVEKVLCAMINARELYEAASMYDLAFELCHEAFQISSSEIGSDGPLLEHFFTLSIRGSINLQILSRLLDLIIIEKMKYHSEGKYDFEKILEAILESSSICKCFETSYISSRIRSLMDGYIARCHHTKASTIEKFTANLKKVSLCGGIDGGVDDSTRSQNTEMTASNDIKLFAKDIFSMQGELLHAICHSAKGEHIAVATNKHGIVDASVLDSDRYIRSHDFLTDTPLRMVLQPKTRNPGKDVVSCALSSHPYDTFYVSGSDQGEALVWRFGSPFGEPEDALLSLPLSCADSKLHETSKTLASVCWSRSGSRIATICRDSRAFLLSPEACNYQASATPFLNGFPVFLSSSATLSCGNGIAFIGSGGSVVACVGESGGGHNLQIIDALAPPRSARVQHSFCHEGGATCLATWNGFQLATGGRNGGVALHDVRMMGDDVPPLWFLPEVHSCTVETMSFANLAANEPMLLVSGGRDGDIHFTGLDGSEYYTIEQAHIRRTFYKQKGTNTAINAAVTGIVEADGGLLSCGTDGNVKLWSRKL